MTPEELARGIVTNFNGEGCCLSNTDETYLEELIAAALREYGEAEYTRGSKAGYERAKDDFNIHD